VGATSDETASAAVPSPPEDGTDGVALGDVRFVVRLRFDAVLGAGFFWFRAGATLIIDPTDGQEEIRYSIIKNASDSRLALQMKIATGSMLSPLRALYFGGLSVRS
jgi:hypothetical protein